jgi:hypothetical protein
MMFPHLSKQGKASGSRLLIVEIHVIRSIKRTFHNRHRMQGQVGQAHGNRIKPAHWTASAQSESYDIGVTHGEVVGNAGFRQQSLLCIGALGLPTEPNSSL